MIRLWLICGGFAIGLAGCASNPAAPSAARPAATQPAWHARIEPGQLRMLDGEPVEDPLTDNAEPPLSREKAFAVLLSTQTFAHTAVGFTAQTPPQIHAFRTLLKQPDAAEAFADLLHRARPAGQLYALCGLYRVDRTGFDAAIQPYTKSTAMVQEFAGCIMARRQADGIAKQIAQGDLPREFAGQR